MQKTEMKWVMNSQGQWVKIVVTRIREGNGWREVRP